MPQQFVVWCATCVDHSMDQTHYSFREGEIEARLMLFASFLAQQDFRLAKEEGLAIRKSPETTA